MLIFLVTLFVIWVVILVIVQAMQLPITGLSQFELTRRVATGDSDAKLLSRRHTLQAEILSLKRAITAILLIGMTVWSIALFGWFLGSVLALIIGLAYGPIAHLAFIRRRAVDAYIRMEPSIFSMIMQTPFFFKLLMSESKQVQSQLGSRQELEHMVEKSHGILSSEEKKLIMNGLSFNDRLVVEIMTPRNMIDTVQKTEFLGPLALDDLHRTGHSRLPVIDKDIDHIVGILHLRGLLALDIKRSVSAEKAMEARVFYIHQDKTLQYALAAFLRTRHHLSIVVNENRETVGLITLEDVIEALLGRKLIDKFDAHDDLRAVALGNPQDNNHPKQSEDD